MGSLLLLGRQCLKSTAPVSWDKADTAVAAGDHHLANMRYADSIQEGLTGTGDPCSWNH